MTQNKHPAEKVVQQLGHRARGRRLNQLGNYLFLAPAVIFIALTMLYPVVYNVYMSLHDFSVGNFLTGDAPFVGLENYRTMIADPVFQHAFIVSLVFTVGSLVVQFILGFAVALFFSRPFPGSGTLRALVLLAWLMPIVVSGNLFRWMLDGSYGVVNLLLRGLGLLDGTKFWLSEPDTALQSTIASNIWVGMPFYMILLLAGLQGISPMLYEAARVDGANAWQRFFYVTLPMMRPVALTVALLGLIYTFKVFDLIFVMTQGGPADVTTVLPILAYELTFQFFRFSEGAALSTLILLIPLCVSLLYLWLIRGEEAA